MTLEEQLQPMMNGTDEEVKKGLIATSPLPETWRCYMSELWARGISKEEFLAWAKEHEVERCQ